VRILLFGGDAVVLDDLAVDAEENRFFLDRKIGAPDLALHRLHPHPQNVGYFGHVYLLLSSNVFPQYAGLS
jgi:hypothetical protein